MKMKNYQLLFIGLLISLPTAIVACPTCVGRLNQESNTFFSEEATTDNNHEATPADDSTQGSGS